MKNLLIYISLTRGFDKEHEELTKIQIDNSLDLGWKVEDIILVTNFDWGYRGVKSQVMGGELNTLDGNRSSKVPVILKLDLGNDLYWFHDHDAFQLEPFGSVTSGFTDHGWSKKWNAGSFFFTSKEKDLFQKIYDCMLERNINEQDALTYLWENGTERNILNITYNLGIYHIENNLKTADGPLMVAHFHPHKLRHLNLFRNILPGGLMAIFSKYGIR